MEPRTLEDLLDLRAIERLKQIVPIWKKEHYADGATWIGSEADCQRELGRNTSPTDIT